MNGFDGLKTGHTDTVNSVILSTDCHFLISLGENFVVFWDAVRGIALKTIPNEDFELIREGKILVSRLETTRLILH